MMEKEIDSKVFFDPVKFIDREVEWELFQELLEFKGQQRILAIDDIGGMGKTQLLGKLWHHCRTAKPHIPSCFISLGQQGNSPLTLIKSIEKELSQADIQLPNFLKFYTALAFGDFSPFLSSIYLQGANFQGATNVTVAGTMTKVEGSDITVNVSASGVAELKPDQQRIAIEVCVKAFLDDLKQLANARAVVLLFDGYEACGNDLKSWIGSYLLHRHFFDLENRPKKLLLVVAGRKASQKEPSIRFDLYWSPEDITSVVGSVRQLGKWEKKHLEEFLQKQGFNYQPDEFDILYRMVQLGLPLSHVVSTLNIMMTNRGIKS
jgi:hypothetical protein